MANAKTSIEMAPAKGRPDVLIPCEGVCNGTALRKAARRMSMLYDDALAPTGLRSTQMAVLIHVARHASPTMGELAGHLVLDRSALSENLKPLIRDGLIQISTGTLDKRVKRVRLTDAGYAKLKDSMGLWQSAQLDFDAAFGAVEAVQFRQYLARIVSDPFLEQFEHAG